MEAERKNTDGARVLIVDDDEDSRIIYPIVLETAGIHADIAANGFEALALILTLKPDLVLLDLAMPKMSGFEVLERLRANPETHNIPVVAFTASPLRFTEESLLQLGFNAVLFKPVEPSTLLRVVQTLLAAR